MLRFLASSSSRPSTFICASLMFSMIEMCGNSSKFWNTMPIWERSFDRLVVRSPTETPLKVMVPS